MEKIELEKLKNRDAADLNNDEELNQKLHDLYLELSSRENETCLRAFHVIQTLADCNVPHAMYILSKAYDYGWGTTKDEKMAYIYFNRALELEWMDAKFEDAMKHIEVRESEEDFNIGFETLIELTNQNYTKAALELAKLFIAVEDEDEDAKNLNQSGLEILDSLVQEKYAPAVRELGMCYLKGHPVDQDSSEGIAYLEHAYYLGSVPAIVDLAEFYLEDTENEKQLQKAIEYLYKACVFEDMRAYYVLSSCYHFGTGVPEDEEEGLKLLKKSADGHYGPACMDLGRYFLDEANSESCLDPSAKFNAGVLYLENAESLGEMDATFRLGLEFLDHSPELAFQKFKKLENRNHPEGLNMLGVCYRQGRGTEPNMEKAFQCFKKSAELGEENAMLSLCDCYFDGIGTKQNYKKAFHWCKKSVENGCAYAKSKLALCYYKGYGCKVNEKKALSLMQEAVDIGNPDAKFLLGMMLIDQEFPSDNDQIKAFELFQSAAEDGNPDAINELGSCYLDGLGVEKNEEQAVSLFQKAAKMGIDAAQFQYGSCLHFGIGCEKNMEESVYWLQKSADQGYLPAVHALGTCYMEGNGVDQNVELAAELFKEAALQDFPDAMISYGYYFLDVEDDRETAITWMAEAARQGSAEGMFALGQLLYTGDGGEQDERAVQLFRKAADLGNDGGQYMLGYCYYYGYCLEQDEEQAKEWLLMSARQGNEEAIEFLNEQFMMNIDPESGEEEEHEDDEA